MASKDRAKRTMTVSGGTDFTNGTYPWLNLEAAIFFRVKEPRRTVKTASSRGMVHIFSRRLNDISYVGSNARNNLDFNAPRNG